MVKELRMTPADLRQLAATVGGPLSLAELLGVGKDWVYRRLSGETPIERVDELAVQQALNQANQESEAT